MLWVQNNSLAGDVAVSTISDGDTDLVCGAEPLVDFLGSDESDACLTFGVSLAETPINVQLAISSAKLSLPSSQ